MEPSFTNYIANDWRLVPLVVGDKATKQTGWNREELTLSDPDDIVGVTAAGLAHAYSKTCAIDIDDIKESRRFLSTLGIDLKALYNAPDAVRLLSGRKNRAKLLYRLDEPLQSVKIIAKVDGVKTNIIDFRCATAAGRTVQDALPPSKNPKTKKPYYWEYADELVGHWSNLPVLPKELHDYWLSEIKERNTEKDVNDTELDEDQLADLCTRIDPDVDYNEWLNVGMALHHATGGSRLGLEIWDNWSKDGQKYKGKKDLYPHYKSFRGSGITLDYLLMQQTADPEVFDDVTDAEPETKGEAKKEKQFPAIRVDEWVLRPPPKWLIQDVLPQSDLAMVFGAPSSGKSFLAMDIAMAICTGVEWRERRTENGPVLWIAAEAAGSVRNRALAYQQHNQISLVEADFFIIGDTPSLNDVSHVRAIAQTAHEIKPELIVIDTLVAASGGSNENSGEDMAVILAACRVLHKVTGALVLLIHHSGKDSTKGARGWSGMKGAMDCEIEVIHQETGERTAKIVKQRDGEQDIEFPFRLTPVQLLDFEGIPQTSCAVDAEEGVLLAEPDLSMGWAAMAVREFLIRGVDSMPKRRFINAMYENALTARADKDTLDENIDQLLDHETDSGVFVVSDKEVALVANEYQNDEEF